MKSIGLIEVSGVTAAIDCLDIMCKSADVEFVTWERKLGGRLVTVVVEGQVSAVTAAVENAMANAIIKPVAHAVIASPHEEVKRLLELSASRMKKKEGTKSWLLLKLQAVNLLLLKKQLPKLPLLKSLRKLR